MASDGPGVALDSLSSEVLLQRVGRGDERAFEKVYDRMAGLVLGIARRVIRNAAQAEEVTQEVMVEIWRTAARFDPERGSASAWVLTLAHRRSVDRVRSAQAATAREHRAAVASGPQDYDEVAEAVITASEHEQVRNALDALSPVQREAIMLAYYRGLTQQQVADELGIPLGTVKTRLRDGLLRLRDVMGVT